MKPTDLMTMRELSEYVGKTRAAIYQWKNAASFPFKVYKNAKGNEAVSTSAVDKWLNSDGTTTTKKKRSTKKAGRKTATRVAAKTVVDKPALKVGDGVVALPLTDDFPISFWSEVVDAMTQRGTKLIISYELGHIVMRHV